MKKSLLAITVMLLALSCSAAKFEKSKTIERTFNLTNTPTLVCDASFSDLVITHSNRSDIGVKIVVVTTAKTEILATKMLEVAKYKFTESGTTLGLEAIIDSDLNQKLNGYNSSSSIKIAYYISLPMESTLRINSKHGDTEIDQINRPLSATITHGSMEISGLVKAQSDLTAKHSKVDIATATAKLNIDMQHSNIVLGKSDDLYIDITHGNIKVASAKFVAVTSSHSNLELGTIESLIVSRSAHDKWKIASLSQSLKCQSVAHSIIKVQNVAPNFSLIEFSDAQHSDIVLYVPRGAFNYDLYGSHSNLQVDTVSSDSSLRGFIGNNPTGSIKVNSRYGDVKVRK